MSGGSWELQARQVRLEVGELRAELQVDRPHDGLRALVVAGERLADAHLMGIEAPAFSAAESPRLLDSFVRGGRLTLAYDETPAWPIHLDATFTAAVEPPALAALDLLVSVRTSLLDSHPALAVRSHIPSEEAFLLADPETGRFEPITSRGFDAVEGSLPVVFRLPGGRLSYVELAYPRGLHCVQASVADPGGLAAVRHPLFPEPLEKGVILRAWLRGLFAPRRADLAAARAAYQALAAAPPPLAG